MVPFVRSRLRRLLVTRARLLVPPLRGLARTNLGYLARYSTWITASEFPEFAGKFPLYQHLIDTRGLTGAIDYLEFGVADGETLRWWVEHNDHPGSRFFGFDSFQGLPEDFPGKPRGSFSTDGKPPEIEDPRCRIEIGMFADRLPGFLDRVTLRHPVVVHLDADLYSSTRFVLDRLGPSLAPGDLLVFDEIGAPRAMTDEYRAWEDHRRDSGTRARIAAGAKHFRVLALEIEGPRPRG